MLDLTFMQIWPNSESLPIQFFLRCWYAVFGVLIYTHYFCKAAAIRRAPVVIKAVLLPVSAGVGVTMIWAGFTGQTGFGALASSIGVGTLISSELIAFAYGARFWKLFDRAAQAKEIGAPRTRSYDARPRVRAGEIKLTSGPINSR